MDKNIILLGHEIWETIKEELVTNFKQGELIPHSWFQNKFNTKDPDIKDFQTTDEYLKALQDERFKYMTLIDNFRWQLLEEKKVFLVNDFGMGYKLLASKEQVEYAYNEALKGIKKEMREAKKIMNNVLPTDHEQQQKDVDLKNKMDIMSNMILHKRR